jgi:acylphosphatase
MNVYTEVHGNVQGVFFRSETVKAAKKIGVTGYVRNTPNDTVDGVAEGDKSKLGKFEQYLNQGPPAASVSKVDTTYSQIKQHQYQDFAQK